MELRPAERLILIMLTEIYKALGIKNGEIDADFLQDAIFGGHTWALDWKHSGMAGDEDVKESVVQQVVDILDMYSLVESSYAGLLKADGEKIEDDWRLSFRGFDGNNETSHMSVARFLVEKMDRFTSYTGREFNSHSPTVGRALRMVAVFEPMRAGLDHHNDFMLTRDQLVEIADAGR